MVDSKLYLDTKILKRLRKQHGLSQERLAEACEKKRLRVSIATIKRAELGKLISLRTAQELAQFYNVDISNLLLQENAQSSLPHASVNLNTSIKPILWLRLSNDVKYIQDIVSLLERRGYVYIEQLGNVIIGIFGNFDSESQSYLRAQRVALEIEQQFQKDNGQAEYFCAALQLGDVQQETNRMIISSSVLHWFAENAPYIPKNSLVVSDKVVQVSQDQFNYSAVEKSEDALFVVESEKYLTHSLPLVGRSSELLQLNAFMDGVNQRATPAIAHITGIAGIGKSRLLNSAIEQAKLRDFLVASIDLEVAWSEPIESLTLHLCRRIYDEACKKVSTRQINTALFEHTIPDARFAFTHFLNIEPLINESNESHDFNIHMNETVLVNAVAILLEVLIKQFSLTILLTIDNFHLAKKEGAFIFASLLNNCKNLPITCLMASRLESNIQEFIKPLAQSHNLMTLSLNGISAQDAQKLSLSFNDIPSNYQKKCIEMSGGVPLYLIQLLSSYSVTEDIPSSLQVLLNHKIHGLSKANRVVVELLSVADFNISLKFLKEILSIIESHHKDDTSYDFDAVNLTYLNEIQIISIDVIHGVKLFHGLVKQSVYEQLSESSKSFYHTLLADFLENHTSEISDFSYASMAHHFSMAKKRIKAANYYYLAASDLINKGFYSRAKVMLLKALSLIESIESPDRYDIEINIQLALSGVYKVKYGWVSSLVKNAYLRIETLCKYLKGDKRLGLALFGLWTIELSTSNFQAAQDLAIRCLETAEKYSDVQGKMHAYIAQSNTLFWLGEFTQAEFMAEQSLEFYKQDYLEHSIQLLGQDPRALAASFGALSASLLGKKEKAESYRHILLNDVKTLGHDFSTAIGLQGSAWLDYHLGNFEGALHYAQELDRLSEEKSFPFYRGVAALFIGWAKHKLYADKTAVETVNQGYHKWLAPSGDKIAYSLYCTILAEIYLDNGNYISSQQLLEDSIQRSLKRHEKCYVPEMYRLLSLCVSGEQREIYLIKGLTLAAENSIFAKRINQLITS